MPEATVNKDCHACAKEDDVRPSGRGCRMQAVPQTGLPKQPTEHKLRRRIPTPDPRHLLGPAEPHVLRVRREPA